MNYLKKIKSLGFKRIQNVVVCRHKYPITGYYIADIQDALKNIKNKNYDWVYPRHMYVTDWGESLKYYNYKLQSYLYKASENFSIYLFVIEGKYTVVIKDDAIEDIVSEYNKNYITRNDVYITIDSELLHDNFWKKILSTLNKDIQREILLRDIFKL
jgi:hypothetical protein